MTQVRDTSEIAEIFGASVIDEDAGERYNVAPTEPIVGVLEQDGRRTVQLLRWGLLPAWARDPREGARRINARAETVAETPAFRVAFQRRRCLIPADGFYEWTRSGRARQPHYIYPVDGSPLAFAGLWALWRPSGSDAWVTSCSVITTRANATVGALHDRMPVVLPADAWDAWLDPEVRDPDLLRSFLVPAPETLLATVPVSRRVNDVQNDGRELVAPLAIESDATMERVAQEPEALTLFGSS